MSSDRLLLFLLGLATWASPALANSRDIYQIRIVLDMERHKLLTPVFREQVARELRDGMQAAFGTLARVEIQEKHPKLADIRSRGLARALDGYQEQNGQHTHFVRIDYSGTHYRIQTRMHNGILGLPAPVVRTGRTDRAYVSRTTLFLMERDLGLLGTIQSEPDAANHVQVQLRGGGLGVDLSRWIQKGEIFRLAQQEASGPARLLEWAYLQVIEPPQEGICTCKLFSRYVLSKTSGLQAELLGTRTGPLRLRLLQEKPGGGVEPLRSPVTLQLRKFGFEGEETTRQQVTATSGREIDTARFGEKGRFSKLAFVSVLTGESLRARIPIAILDDNPVVLTVPATNEEGDLVTFRFRMWKQNVLTAYIVQTEQFKTINELTAKPDKRAQALQSVRKTLERLHQDHTRLSTQHDEVMKEIEKLDLKNRPRPEEIKAITDRLKLIRSGETELLRIVQMLEKIEKEENDPKRKEWLVKIEGAKALESEGEFGQAIAVYEQAPAEFQTKELKEHLAKLKKLWEPRDAQHAKARKFIFEAWPKLDTPGLKKQIADAHQALQVCVKAGDWIGATRLLRGLEIHLQRIEKELQELKPETNIDDEKPAKLIKELIPDLQVLDRTIREFLENNKSEG